MEDWSGSSIDGSLDDGLDHSRNSIFGNYLMTMERKAYNDDEPESPPEGRNLESVSHTTKITFNATEEDISLLIPSCLKLNKILSDVGFSPIELLPSDLDLQKRTISVFVVDSWAQSLVNCVSELLAQQSSHRVSMEVLSHNIGRNGATQSSLETSISSLKESLEATERRERLAVQKLESVEKECNDLMKQMADLNFESKKKIKNLETLIQESERKLRQKEVEYNKLKQKLQALNSKDLEHGSERNQALIAHRRGDIDVSISSDRSSNSSSSAASQQLKSRTHSAAVILNKDATSPKKSKKAKEITPDEVILALQMEKSELLSHTEDLEREIANLTSQLKVSYRTIQDLQLPNETSESEIPSSQFVRGNVVDNQHETESGELLESNQRDLKSQSDRIRLLVHQLEEQKSLVSELHKDNQHLKEKNANLTRSVENLRLELGSRPTVKEYKEKIKEINELESQLRDIIVMRRESEEVKSWNKHLSTREKILIDKKNYELKLWLLESLPKTVMKEVLQGVCRELELNEVSDIVEAIKKLKLVIKTVPRMERFISTVCNFVFERTTPTHLEGDIIDRPVMEDVFPILKKWWKSCQEAIQLKRFHDEVLYLVEKVEIQTTSNLDYSKVNPKGVVSHHEIFQRIKSLIDFQRNIFSQAKNWEAAERFLVERPEIVVNGILEHIQYLFGVNRLEGLIPKLNEIYLFSEEMSNFMMNLREMLQFKSDPDATVITEVYRIIQMERNSN